MSQGQGFETKRDQGVRLGAAQKVLRRRFVAALLFVTGSALCLGFWGGELRSEPANPPAQNPRARSKAAQVSALILQLDHSRAAVRREAVMRLSGLGAAAGPAVPRLMGLLQDPDPLVRAHAARTACRIGLAPEPVIPVLTELLQPKRPQSCCLAALILGDLGSPAHGALPALRVCLAAQAPIVRLHAAEAILKIDPADNDSLDELLSAVEDEEAAIRYFAVNALGSSVLDDELAVVALEQALTDRDTNVASSAALNLSKRDERAQFLPAPEPVDFDQGPSTDVVRLITELSHAVPTVRRSAAIELGLRGSAAVIAVPALRERLRDPDLIVRVHAARALWAIGPQAEEILPVLVDLLGIDHPNVTVAATQTLGRMGEAAAAALPSLRDVLEASEFLDRLVLADAISHIDPREHDSLLVLTTGLHDPEGDVRYLSALALGTAPLVNCRRIEQVLRPALNDRNLRVQGAARESFDRLRGRIAATRNRLDAACRAATCPVTTASAPAARSDIDPAELKVRLAAAVEATEEARAAAQLATEAAAQARAQVPSRAIAGTAPQRATRSAAGEIEIPPLPATKLVQGESPAPAARDTIADSDEGLKPISALRASIAVPEGPLPEEVATPRLAAAGINYHGYGARRGWQNVSFGWDAPAMYFKPIYFQDVNLERYGRHFGCYQPFVSWGMFYYDCLFLPYKLIAQPPCECMYTLGYNRPNNCVPLQCCAWWYPKLTNRSWNPWRAACCTCPIHPADPWNCHDDE